jgi:hypothetical protein
VLAFLLCSRLLYKCLLYVINFTIQIITLFTKIKNAMPTSCTDSVPSFAGEFNYCAPAYVFGEIEEVIIAPLELESGDPYPTPWTDKAAWDALLAPTLPDLPVAFKIPVRGTMDEPDQPEIETSGYRTAFPPARYNVPLMVDDLNEQVYENLRQMNNVTVRMWLISGGKIFGGPTGIEADLRTWPIIEEGEDAMHKYHIHASWRAALAPERAVSPFAPSTTATPTI